MKGLMRIHIQATAQGTVLDLINGTEDRKGSRVAFTSLVVRSHSRAQSPLGIEELKNLS